MIKFTSKLSRPVNASIRLTSISYLTVAAHCANKASSSRMKPVIIVPMIEFITIP